MRQSQEEILEQLTQRKHSKNMLLMQHSLKMNLTMTKEDVYNPPLYVKELEENIKKLQEPNLIPLILKRIRLTKNIRTLREVSMKAANKLEELNLSNAKLLYQNRILESDSLNERQKQRLVEKVSNAESIKEAKIIFDTLNEELEARKNHAHQRIFQKSQAKIVNLF